MNKRKILFSDLDATLLNDKKEIEPHTRKAIEKMRKQGHIFAICTGRPLSSAKAVARQFRLDQKGCFIVAYNGGVIYDPASGNIISYESIPLPVVQRMFKEAEKAGLYIHTYDRKTDTVMTYQRTPELETYIGHTKLPPKVGPDILLNLTDEPAKMIVICLTDNQRLQQFQEMNAEWSKNILNSFFSCEQYLEYCPAGVSKGAAVQKLCTYLNIPIEQSVATGDERNDISMLKMAGIGVAPANAFHLAKASADDVCVKDNNEGAVGEIIQKYILQP